MARTTPELIDEAQESSKVAVVAREDEEVLAVESSVEERVALKEAKEAKEAEREAARAAAVASREAQAKEAKEAIASGRSASFKVDRGPKDDKALCFWCG